MLDRAGTQGGAGTLGRIRQIRWAGLLDCYAGVFWAGKPGLAGLRRRARLGRGLGFCTELCWSGLAPGKGLGCHTFLERRAVLVLDAELVWAGTGWRAWLGLAGICCDVGLGCDARLGFHVLDCAVLGWRGLLWGVLSCHGMIWAEQFSVGMTWAGVCRSEVSRAVFCWAKPGRLAVDGWDCGITLVGIGRLAPLGCAGKIASAGTSGLAGLGRRALLALDDALGWAAQPIASRAHDQPSPGSTQPIYSPTRGQRRRYPSQLIVESSSWTNRHMSSPNHVLKPVVNLAIGQPSP